MRTTFRGGTWDGLVQEGACGTYYIVPQKAGPDQFYKRTRVSYGHGETPPVFEYVLDVERTAREAGFVPARPGIADIE